MRETIKTAVGIALVALALFMLTEISTGCEGPSCYERCLEYCKREEPLIPYDSIEFSCWASCNEHAPDFYCDWGEVPW